MDENGYESNQRYDGSLKENLPKGLMERLPEELKEERNKRLDKICREVPQERLFDRS